MPGLCCCVGPGEAGQLGYRVRWRVEATAWHSRRHHSENPRAPEAAELKGNRAGWRSARPWLLYRMGVVVASLLECGVPPATRDAGEAAPGARGTIGREAGKSSDAAGPALGGEQWGSAEERIRAGGEPGTGARVPPPVPRGGAPTAGGGAAGNSSCILAPMRTCEKKLNTDRFFNCEWHWWVISLQIQGQISKN
jgi:hypothetical protein